MIKTINLDRAASKKTSHQVDVRTLYDNKNIEIRHFTLQPGESLKKHAAPIDVLFYVLEGTGTIEIGEETKEVTADTLVESPAETMRRWYNDSDNPLRVLVLRLVNS